MMMCADVAVARNGQGAMSMAACFGAPVLNDLLGFGKLTCSTSMDSMSLKLAKGFAMLGKGLICVIAGGGVAAWSGIALTSYCLRTQSSFKVHLSDPSYRQVRPWTHTFLPVDPLDTLSHRPWAEPRGVLSWQVKLLWCFLLPLLVVTFVCFSLPAFTPNRTYALLLLTLYATFLLLAALLESHVIGMP